MRRAGAGGEFLFSSLRLLVPKIQKSLSLAVRGAKRTLEFLFWTHDQSLHAGVVLGEVGYLPFHTFGTNVANSCTLCCVILGFYDSAVTFVG